MTGIVTKHLIEKQIPYHIRESNPLFTKFLQYYYEFQQQSNISAIIQDVKNYNDIDAAEEQFLLDFFEEFKNLPHSTVADKRLVAKHVYDLYKAKGSEQSLKLLFRIVYGEEVEVNYPHDDVLRASDGRWIQDNTITLRTVSGEIKSSSNKIEFSTSHGTYIFELKDYDVYSVDVVRVVFEPRKSYYFENSQQVKVYTNDTLDFVGESVQMPIQIDVESGGAFWQVGQVIVLPGPDRDTICQVKRVDANGAIKRIEIIQYGIGLTSDTSYVVSPFVYKPNTSYTEAYTEKISEFPPAYKHNLNIFDISEDIVESIIGVSTDQDYVLQGYIISGYISRIAFSQNFIQMNDPGIINDEITLDQWITSKARLKLRLGFNAKSGGYYEDVKGQPSAASVRLQDNFFYQLFSYVITTSKMLSEYKNVLSLIHPAGVKYFSNLNKEVFIDANITASRVLSREVASLDSSVYANDSVERVQTLPRFVDYVLATNSNTENNYDENNGLPNAEIDWDEIVMYDGIYASGDYDANTYDIPDEKYPDSYTLEDDKITITKT